MSGLHNIECCSCYLKGLENQVSILYESGLCLHAVDLHLVVILRHLTCSWVSNDTDQTASIDGVRKMLEVIQNIDLRSESPLTGL